MTGRLGSQCRVIWALMVRESSQRLGKRGTGLLWTVLEPALHVAFFVFLFSLFNRRAPVGTSMELFFVTGILPFFAFQKVAGRTASAISANRALLYLPPVHFLDVIVARSLSELFLFVVSGIVVMVGLFLIGIDSIPVDAMKVINAICAAYLLGMSLGLVNAVAGGVSKLWAGIHPLLLRPLYFFSGVFYVPDHMPPQIRDILVWNPVLHIAGWFRQGFYPGYARFTLDLDFLFTVILALAVAGLVLERTLRRRLRAQPG